MEEIEIKKKLNESLRRMDELKKFGITVEWEKAINHCKHILTSEFKFDDSV